MKLVGTVSLLFATVLAGICSPSLRGCCYFDFTNPSNNHKLSVNCHCDGQWCNTTAPDFGEATPGAVTVTCPNAGEPKVLSLPTTRPPGFQSVLGIPDATPWSALRQMVCQQANSTLSVTPALMKTSVRLPVCSAQEPRQTSMPPAGAKVEFAPRLPSHVEPTSTILRPEAMPPIQGVPRPTATVPTGSPIPLGFHKSRTK
ncbi:hypothetical protein GE09DRAFT_1196524 [Coniochaeta sp. 2T2.1]|nr:hypothetical protein GE09DRAFT_1196524 [Coniochaeta sp. 2T2.1]